MGDVHLASPHGGVPPRGAGRPATLSATIRALAAIGVAASLACHGNRDHGGGTPAPAPSDSLVLERTACFGACPTYVLAIAGTGVATFTGTGRMRGRSAVDTLASSTVRALFARVDSVRPWELADHYTPQYPEQCGRYFTDAPSAVLTVKRGARRKQIDDYFGCPSAPKTLRALEETIDSAARVSRWTGAPGDLEPKPPR